MSKELGESQKSAQNSFLQPLFSLKFHSFWIMRTWETLHESDSFQICIICYVIFFSILCIVHNKINIRCVFFQHIIKLRRFIKYIDVITKSINFKKKKRHDISSSWETRPPQAQLWDNHDHLMCTRPSTWSDNFSLH